MKDDCKTCGHYEIKKMVTSGKPLGYSGDIPCFRCTRYNDGKTDEHTNSTHLLEKGE